MACLVGKLEKYLHMLKIISIFAERYPNTIRGNRRKGMRKARIIRGNGRKGKEGPKGIRDKGRKGVMDTD